MKDARLWPTPENEIRQLLRFFLIEKAFYEIEYEIGHRPEWLTLPLSGALRAFGA
jgi:maltose alpha-D-glucosyltransferase/alpha-amylase